MSFFGSYFPMEYLMYGAIGFFAAWLMAFMCFPAVHNRAERLLRRQYEQAPLSIQEMRAEKDQIRASFAAATRDLEVSLEKLKEKTAAHATELARKAQVIERLKKELGALSDELTESTEREREARAQLLEARREFDAVNEAFANVTERERSVRAELRETRRELSLKDGALDAAEREVSAIRTEIARLAPLLQASSRKDEGLRAFTEIDAAARRVEQRYDGAPSNAPLNAPLKKPLSNQTLRAAFAPAMKPAN